MILFSPNLAPGETMQTTLLRDVLIEQNQLERYFDGFVPVHLWRALNAKQNRSLFEFVETPYMMSNGRPRPADIFIVKRGTVSWVTVKDRPRGISTFDAPGVPNGKDWHYYLIPSGTALPPGLAIVRDEKNSRFGATHYTIAPAYDMPLEQFKNLLNTLALSAIKAVG